MKKDPLIIYVPKENGDSADLWKGWKSFREKLRKRDPNYRFVLFVVLQHK